MAHYSSFRGVSSGIGAASKPDNLASNYKYELSSSKYGGGIAATNPPNVAFYTPGRVAPTNSLRGVSSGPGMTTTTTNAPTAATNLNGTAQSRVPSYSIPPFSASANTGGYTPSNGGPVLGNRRLLEGTNTNIGSFVASPHSALDYKSRFGKESHTLQSGYKAAGNYSNPLSSGLGNTQSPSSRPSTASRMSEQPNSPQGLSNETYGQLGPSTVNRTSSQSGATGYSSSNRWATQNRYISNNYGNYNSVERRTSSGLLDGNRVSLGPSSNPRLDSNAGFSMTQKLPSSSGAGLGISTFNTASKPVLPSEVNNLSTHFEENQPGPFGGSEATPSGLATKYYGNFTRHQGMERASKTGGNWTSKKESTTYQPLEEGKHGFY